MPKPPLPELRAPTPGEAKLAGALVLAAGTAGGIYLLVRHAGPGGVEVVTAQELARYAGGGLLPGAAARLWLPRLAAVRVPGQRLPAWPAGLGRQAGTLRALDLSGCGLGSVPPSVGALTSLTRLALARNGLAAVPPELGGLQALVDLDLGGNQLEALPDELCGLRRLQYLNAMSNRLAALPEALGGLRRLLRLGLKGNALRALPASLGQLEEVRELFLTDNQLGELPECLAGCTALVKLQASFNPGLKRLASALGALPRLELLRVACCDVDFIPQALHAAPRLAWLSLASNPACRGAAARQRGAPAVDAGELVMGRKLGEGASGDVYEAAWRGRRVAVKLFRAERSPDGHSRDEIAIALAVDDPGLVRVLGRLDRPLGLVMEYVEGAPLAEKPNHESLLRCRWAPGARYGLAFVLRCARCVAGALEHMHYRGIAHGDVYAHNVLADAAGHAVLCDYGASFIYHKSVGQAFEAQEARAFGLLLSDLVARMDLEFAGLEAGLVAQKELLLLAQLCSGTPVSARPSFGAVGRKLKALQKAVEAGAAKAARQAGSPGKPGKK